MEGKNFHELIESYSKKRRELKKEISLYEDKIYSFNGSNPGPVKALESNIMKLEKLIEKRPRLPGAEPFVFCPVCKIHSLNHKEEDGNHYYSCMVCDYVYR